MARSLALRSRISFGVVALALLLAQPLTTAPAAAADLDRKGKADAKVAMQFYKEGNYEDAAKIFVKLSIAYPEMLVFARNLGASYYYLKRPEPALSNLRDYLHRKKDIALDDRVEVERWIAEMEHLREQASAPPAPALAAAQGAAALPLPSPSAPPAPAQSEPAIVSAPPSAQAPVVASAVPDSAGPAPASPPAATGYYQPGSYGSAPNYPPQPYGTQGYPMAQYPAPAPGGAPAYAPVYGASAPPPAGVIGSSGTNSDGSGRRAAAWILGAVGVAGVGTGVVFTVLALDKFSKVERKFDPNLEKQGKRDATYQWVFYGIGAAAITAATIVGSSDGSSPPGVALAPIAGLGTAGATLAGSF